MKFLVFGGGGQLATEIRLLSKSYSQHEFFFRTSSEVDITSADAVNIAIETVLPNVVINAAAYTAVDKAESESEKAFLINAEGVRNIAEGCKNRSIRLLHVSTDFVFSGEAFRPYPTETLVSPVSVYGASKAKCDMYLRKILPKLGLIARTSWLYSSHSPCFLNTMRRLMSERTEIGVVCDQIGTPTSVTTLAEWLIYAAEISLVGTYHVSDAGVGSWYDFACAINEMGQEFGQLNTQCSVKPIMTFQFPTPARRPWYSVMDASGSFLLNGAPKQFHWRERLTQTLLK